MSDFVWPTLRMYWHNTETCSALSDILLCCRYYRLPLPMEGAPLEEDFDSFVNILRVSRCKNVHHAQVHQLKLSLFGCPTAGVGLRCTIKLWMADIFMGIWIFSQRRRDVCVCVCLLLFNYQSLYNVVENPQFVTTLGSPPCLSVLCLSLHSDRM